MYLYKTPLGYTAINKDLKVVGGGYFYISPVIAERLISALPHIDPIVQDNVVVDFMVLAPETTPEPQMDDITALQLAVAELVETQAADQTANELALAELAEMMGG